MTSLCPFFAPRTYSACSSPRTVSLIVVLFAPRLNSNPVGLCFAAALGHPGSAGDQEKKRSETRVAGNFDDESIVH